MKKRTARALAVRFWGKEAGNLKEGKIEIN